MEAAPASAAYVSLAVPRDVAALLAEQASRGLPVALSRLHCAALVSALASAGVLPASPADALAPLPLPVVLDIALRLPVADRLLLALLSRAFRALAADTSLWQDVNLTVDGGVDIDVVSDDLLHAVATRAGGRMTDLNLSELVGDNGPLSWAALHEAVAANAGSLRRVKVLSKLETPVFAKLADVARVLATAAGLEKLDVDLCCPAADAPGVLRGEPPYGPLRVVWIKITGPWAGERSILDVAGTLEASPTLTEVRLEQAPLQTAVAVDAVVDAVIKARLNLFCVDKCSLGPAAAPALARLLRDGKLATLLVCYNIGPLLDAASASVFCTALRACRLQSLTLADVRLWANADVCNTVVSALIAHPTVATLWLNANRALHGAQAVVGTALSFLLSADTPALTELNISDCGLGDAGLRPVFTALRGCTHLRTLICIDAMSYGFVQDVLLPAVTANRSLRSLNVGGNSAATAAPMLLQQAEALVAARPPVA